MSNMELLDVMVTMKTFFWLIYGFGAITVWRRKSNKNPSYLCRLLYVSFLTISQIVMTVYFCFLTTIVVTSVGTCTYIAKAVSVSYGLAIMSLFALMSGSWVLRLRSSMLWTTYRPTQFVALTVKIVLKVLIVSLVIAIAVLGFFAEGKYAQWGTTLVCVVDLPPLLTIIFGAIVLLFCPLFTALFLLIRKRMAQLEGPQVEGFQKTLRVNFYITLFSLGNTVVVLVILRLMVFASNTGVWVGWTIISCCSVFNCVLSECFTKDPHTFHDATSVEEGQPEAERVFMRAPYEYIYEFEGDEREPPSLQSTTEVSRQMEHRHSATETANPGIKGPDDNAWWRVKICVFGLSRVTEGHEWSEWSERSHSRERKGSRSVSRRSDDSVSMQFVYSDSEDSPRNNASMERKLSAVVATTERKQPPSPKLGAIPWESLSSMSRHKLISPNVPVHEKMQLVAKLAREKKAEEEVVIIEASNLTVLLETEKKHQQQTLSSTFTPSSVFTAVVPPLPSIPLQSEGLEPQGLELGSMSSLGSMQGIQESNFQMPPRRARSLGGRSDLNANAHESDGGSRRPDRLSSMSRLGEEKLRSSTGMHMRQENEGAGRRDISISSFREENESPRSSSGPKQERKLRLSSHRVPQAPIQANSNNDSELLEENRTTTASAKTSDSPSHKAFTNYLGNWQ
eukprot:g18926.t1